MCIYQWASFYSAARGSGCGPGSGSMLRKSIEKVNQLTPLEMLTVLSAGNVDNPGNVNSPGKVDNTGKVDGPRPSE